MIFFFCISCFHPSISLSLAVSVSPSSSAFLFTFPEEHSLQHKESQTNQSNLLRHRAPANQEVTSPGLGVNEDNGYRVGGNFLPQGTAECVRVCCLCLRFCLHIIWRQYLLPRWPGQKWTDTQTHTQSPRCCQTTGGVSYDSATRTPVLLMKPSVWCLLLLMIMMIPVCAVGHDFYFWPGVWQCGDISEFVDISAAHAPINQPSSTKIQRVWQRPRVKTNNKTNTRKSHIC